MSSVERNTALLTGSTGLVGSYLLRDLSEMGQPLAVLVRPTCNMSSKARVDDILNRWDTPLPPPKVIEGDLRQPGLGLLDQEQRWVAENCNQVIHAAAALRFEENEITREPWRTNVTGTQHLLQLSKKIGLSQWTYISTAYVCGDRDGIVRSYQLDQGQSFTNPYEQSKLDAEKKIRVAAHIDKLTIFRPSIIVGDSKTGYTSQYQGIYTFLRLGEITSRLYRRLRHEGRDITIRLPMTGNERINVVPIDWVSAVICRLLNDSKSVGATYHLVNEKPITPAHIIGALSDFYRLPKFHFVGHSLDSDEMNSFERIWHRSIMMYQKYATSHDPIFDNSRFREAARDLVCPTVDRQMLKRLIEYAEKDHWGGASHATKWAEIKR